MVDQWFQVVNGINKVVRFAWKNDFYWMNVFVDLKTNAMDITTFYTYSFIDGHYRYQEVPPKVLSNLRLPNN